MKLSIYKEVHVLAQHLQGEHCSQIQSVKVTPARNVRLTVVPDSGIWQGRTYLFEIKAKKYPIKPCKVRCLSPILHPNILEIDGEVCLSIFDEDWNPAMTLMDYMQGILYIFHHPNFDDPLSDYFCIAREKGTLKAAIENCTK